MRFLYGAKRSAAPQFPIIYESTEKSNSKQVQGRGNIKKTAYFLFWLAYRARGKGESVLIFLPDKKQEKMKNGAPRYLMNDCFLWGFCKEKAMPNSTALQKKKRKMNIIFQESSIRFPIEYRAFPVH